MIFTGDIFTKTRVRGSENPRNRDVMIVQHPCALRLNGIDLLPRLLVADVAQFNFLEPEDWQGHFDKMPLPFLYPDATSEKKKHAAAFFGRPYLLAPEDIDLSKRVATLTPNGVNIVLQRSVAHSSRVIVPTYEFQKIIAGPYEEADLTEEWCDDRVGGDVTIEQASKEALNWLREDLGDGVPMRQSQLNDPQQVSTIRKDMRAALKALRAEG
jgi:hypothetical protein